MTITTVNPATGTVLATYATADVEAVLSAATSARLAWAARDDRPAVLRQVAAVLRERAGRLARLITAEMGKPLAEAAAEVEKCARTCDFYADHGPAFLADERVSGHAWISYEPLGTVLAVMPWNFPLWQAIRFAAPALVAGNAAVLKPAATTAGCALALADVLADAGVPHGVFGVLLLTDADTPEVVAGVIADDRIDAVTVTGSERAGAAVASAAGAAVKKSVLELGGSDPFVVRADVSVPDVVPAAVRARFGNAGQSCISAKRFVVARGVYAEFVDALSAAVKELVIGDPAAPGTTMGPLARPDLVDAIDRQVTGSAATVVTGGHRLGGPGNFYAPTVLTDVAVDAPVWREETFGPVAVVVPAEDDDHAVALANDTRWGLGASVWTRDLDAGRAVAARLRSGAVFLNEVVASDPSVPFGGVGRSGYGRELAVAGLREFVNTRTWWSA